MYFFYKGSTLLERCTGRVDISEHRFTISFVVPPKCALSCDSSNVLPRRKQRHYRPWRIHGFSVVETSDAQWPLRLACPYFTLTPRSDLPACITIAAEGNVSLLLHRGIGAATSIVSMETDCVDLFKTNFSSESQIIAWGTVTSYLGEIIEASYPLTLSEGDTWDEAEVGIRRRSKQRAFSERERWAAPITVTLQSTSQHRWNSGKFPWRST